MKCPLLAFAWGNEGGKEPLVYPDCLKEECAWWNKGEETCEILLLGCALEAISDTLEDIAKELTLLRPPRR